jgi:hypothetical protein
MLPTLLSSTAEAVQDFSAELALSRFESVLMLLMLMPLLMLLLLLALSCSCVHHAPHAAEQHCRGGAGL